MCTFMQELVLWTAAAHKDVESAQDQIGKRGLFSDPVIFDNMQRIVIYTSRKSCVQAWMYILPINFYSVCHEYYGGCLP